MTAAAVATLLTCSDKKTSSGGCKQESDCADGFTCGSGDCVEKAAGNGVCTLCTTSSDCDAQYVCAQIEVTRKACVPACDTASPNCPIGFHCADGAAASGAACIPNTAVCCVDQDGDGYGAGIDCANTDCSDTNPHCTTDCTDADGDTWCVGHDCDDTKPNCDADCTDNDGDDWCVGHDCNDNDALLTDVCPVCEVDEDGDGYGVGCALGPDCDDANPHCNADCTAVDGDGWCLGRDCDDNLPNCDADCTDPDGDGYCGIKDCDPANGHCFSTCVDAMTVLVSRVSARFPPCGPLRQSTRVASTTGSVGRMNAARSAMEASMRWCSRSRRPPMMPYQFLSAHVNFASP